MIFTIKKVDIEMLNHQGNSDFEDLFFNWHEEVSELINDPNTNKVKQIDYKLTDAQKFFYYSYNIDSEVRNGGFLQILLNCNMYLTFQVLRTKLSRTENLKLFSTLVYNANKRIDKIGLEVANKEFYKDNPELAYEKYEHMFNPLDDLILIILKISGMALKMHLYNTEKNY